MSNTQQHQPQAPIELPDNFNFDSSGAKLVYLYLQIENEATIDQLQAALGMKKLALYSLLQTLTTTDYVDQYGTRYVCQQTPNGGTR